MATNRTLQGNRLNVITKKATSWAAIIAEPTAITGFYGQNLPYPGFAITSVLFELPQTFGGHEGLFVLFRHPAVDYKGHLPLTGIDGLVDEGDGGLELVLTAAFDALLKEVAGHVPPTKKHALHTDELRELNFCDLRRVGGERRDLLQSHGLEILAAQPPDRSGWREATEQAVVEQRVMTDLGAGGHAVDNRILALLRERKCGVTLRVLREPDYQICAE